jgi:transposase
MDPSCGREWHSAADEIHNAYGLLNHCDHPINNGRLEGLNNKIKVIKRRCYGFHDLDYFTLKIKQASPRSRSP